MGRSQRTGGGSAIYLGSPVAIPPGVCIGLPGPTFFRSSTQPTLTMENVATITFTPATVTVTVRF